MRAEKALAQSPDGLIVADASGGLVTIYHEPGEVTESGDAFHVRFVLRDRDGNLNGAGIVEVGSYDDLDIALTIAAVGYGVGETWWRPTSLRRLMAIASHEHAPEIEGRRITHQGGGTNEEG